MYVAAALTPLSAELLKWMIRATIKLEDKGYKFKTSQGSPLPHHMTINLGEFDSDLNNIEILGLKAELFIEELVYNDTIGIAAAPVRLARIIEEKPYGMIVNSKNICPHITLCSKEGVLSRLSNNMLELPHNSNQRFRLEERLRLEARISYCK